MQYDPHWFFATSANTLNPRLRSSSTMPSFACSSKFSKACWKGYQSRDTETSQETKVRTWTTKEPVSWQASDAHLPFKDLLTLPVSLIWGQSNGERIYKAKMGGAGGVQVNSIILLQTWEACLLTNVWAGSPRSSSETMRSRTSSSQSRAFWRT